MIYRKPFKGEKYFDLKNIFVLFNWLALVDLSL